MTRTFLLFDMDGVLLKPMGYHESLRASIRRIGQSLGAPKVELSHTQIAQIESLGITNEWDSLAIFTALILLQTWQTHPDVRLTPPPDGQEPVIKKQPDFDTFLQDFRLQTDLPGEDALAFLLKRHPDLNTEQHRVLKTVLKFSRNLDQSPILADYQETVLGSHSFEKTYGLKSRLAIESFLLTRDKRVLSNTNERNLKNWLAREGHAAGIMTNRPSGTPEGYQSSPEAELGAELVRLSSLPLLGAGLLAWFAVTQMGIPDFTLLKPNPVHALALLQACLGQPILEAIATAVRLWQGDPNLNPWKKLAGTRVVVFEDAAKGLVCGENAQALLARRGIQIHLEKIGVSQQPAKIRALRGLADRVIPDLNQVDWERDFGSS